MTYCNDDVVESKLADPALGFPPVTDYDTEVFQYNQITQSFLLNLLKNL